MEVPQLGGALGAEIRGMDLSQPPDYLQLMVLENRPGKPATGRAEPMGTAKPGGAILPYHIR